VGRTVVGDVSENHRHIRSAHLAEMFWTCNAKAYDFVEQHAELGPLETHVLRASFSNSSTRLHKSDSALGERIAACCFTVGPNEGQGLW
jgi:hypothetical protein